MMDKFLKIDLVINFFNRDEILVQKLMGRRVCPNCHKNFNVASIKTDDGYLLHPLLPKGDHHKCDRCHDVKL
jgi:adenylate kinase